MKQDPTYIRWFAEITLEDVPSVGGKNASLGEMYRELTPQGVKIPNGFAITAAAYWHVIKSAAILEHLKDTMTGLDKTDVDNLAIRGKKARALIVAAGIPEDLWAEIKAAYYSNVISGHVSEDALYGQILKSKRKHLPNSTLN